MGTNQSEVSNNLVWAILTTLFCCLPFGIVSIVYASKVDGLRIAGNIPAAVEMSQKARNWAIAAAVSPIVGVVVWVLFFGGISMLGAMLSV